MIVTRLSLTDFRNYAAADLELLPGPNVFVGRNGQGKTNLVESIAYLSTLGSHRVPTDQALIRSGADAAIIRARLEYDGRQVLAELQLNRSGANRAQVNRVPVKSRELPRYVATVLFAPEDLALVRGEPSGRRRFLDQLLVQLTPRLAGEIADYERVLKQRNSLLKSARGTRNPELSTLELWDERLIALGTAIIQSRARVVDLLRPHVAAAYERIAGPGHRAELAVALSIFATSVDDDPSDGDPAGHTDDEVADGFRAALARVRRSELERGVTLAGPHRDDLLLLLNDLPARGYASHGESWSFALALKLASAAVLRADSPTGDPVVILDDVFAELDEGRRAQLASAVGDYEQVLITAAVFSDVPVELAGHVVQIEAGADHGRDAGGGGMTEEEEPPEHVAVFRRIRASFGDPSLRSGTRGGAGGRHATRRACRTEPVENPGGSPRSSRRSPPPWAGNPRSLAPNYSHRGATSWGRRPPRTPSRSASRRAC